MNPKHTHETTRDRPILPALPQLADDGTALAGGQPKAFLGECGTNRLSGSRGRDLDLLFHPRGQSPLFPLSPGSQTLRSSGLSGCAARITLSAASGGGAI